MAPEPGIDEPPVWQVVIRPAALASRDQRHVIVGGLHRAEAGLGERHAFAGELDEIVCVRPGSRMTEPAMTRMPPGR